MFGLTDTDLQVHALRHNETVARGETRARLELALAPDSRTQRARKTSPTTPWARIVSLFRAPIHSLPAGS
jgi:hypothetical protein